MMNACLSCCFPTGKMQASQVGESCGAGCQAYLLLQYRVPLHPVCLQCQQLVDLKEDWELALVQVLLNGTILGLLQRHVSLTQQT